MQRTEIELEVEGAVNDFIADWPKSSEEAGRKTATSELCLLARVQSYSTNLYDPRFPSLLTAMASRSLALRLNQGLRAQRAIQSIKSKSKPGLVRSLATPVNYGQQTESTTLSNGFTVCSH